MSVAEGGQLSVTCDYNLGLQCIDQLQAPKRKFNLKKLFDF